MAPTTAHQWLVVYGNSANQIAAFALVYLPQAAVFLNKALVIILTHTRLSPVNNGTLRTRQELNMACNTRLKAVKVKCH